MHESERDKFLSVVAELWSEAGKKSILKVSGISMSPMLLDDESIQVDHFQKDLRMGDVGVFNRNGLIFVHRVLFKKRESNTIVYRTKGDWMLFMDQPVQSDSVAGKVCAFTRGSRQYDLNAAASKIYAKIMALYSFAIAVDGKAANLADTFLSFLKREEVRFFRNAILRIDRTLLKIFHAIFFRLFNKKKDGSLAI